MESSVITDIFYSEGAAIRPYGRVVTEFQQHMELGDIGRPCTSRQALRRRYTVPRERVVQGRHGRRILREPGQRRMLLEVFFSWDFSV